MQGITRFEPSPSGYTHGTVLARAFGLNENYFTEACYKGIKLSSEIDIRLFNEHWMVKIPPKYYELMDNGYIALIATKQVMDEVKFADFLKLTRKTTIGFYK